MSKWILRLLMVVVFLGAFFLFALKIASGPGEQQKAGLEQAFSRVFQGDASFEQLVAFNLFPQFKISIQGVRVVGAFNAGNITAEKFDIAFSAMDLILKTRKAEQFSIKNMVADKGVLAPKMISITESGLYPNGDKGLFNFKGKYGDKDIHGQMDIGIDKGNTPKFFLKESNDFKMNIGAVQLNGAYVPFEKDGGYMTKISFLTTAKRRQLDCTLAEDKHMPAKEFFTLIVVPLSTLDSEAQFQPICDSLK